MILGEEVNSEFLKGLSFLGSELREKRKEASNASVERRESETNANTETKTKTTHTCCSLFLPR